MISGDNTDPLAAAAEAAHQLELEKKLQEGQEPVSISQQENCSIKVMNALDNLKLYSKITALKCNENIFITTQNTW